MENIIRTEIEDTIRYEMDCPTLIDTDTTCRQGYLTDTICGNLMDELNLEYDELADLVNEMLDEYEDELDKIDELAEMEMN